MGVKFTRELERLVASTDDETCETTIIVTQDFIDAGTRQNPNAVIPSPLKKARTIEGFACRVIDENTFVIVNHPLGADILVRRRH